VNYSSDNVFQTIPVGKNEAGLFNEFLDANDFAEQTRKAFSQDIRKFAGWFAESNRESFSVSRVTTRDVTDFKNHLRRAKGQAVATVNRALVTVRRFFGWLVDQDHVPANPAKKVKELRRQELAPKGMERSQVRRLLREIELRQDVRANAVFSLLLYTGCRVGDLVGLELDDLMIGERSGSVVFRFGKGNKQRSVPLPLPARRALQTYLESRPPVESQRVFIGERGPLSDRGIRALCDKYGAIIGVRIHPHLLRHTMAHKFLEDNQNDLVSLSQLLGHSNLNTTARYTKRSQDQLADAVDNLEY
jgi:site-specific recombinase XerD